MPSHAHMQQCCTVGSQACARLVQASALTVHHLYRSPSCRHCTPRTCMPMHACTQGHHPLAGSGSGHEEAAQTVRSCCNVGYQSSWASNYSIHTAMRIPSCTSHPLPLLPPSPQLVAPAKWLWPLSGATQVRPVNSHFRNTSTRSLQQEQSTQLQLCLP